MRVNKSLNQSVPGGSLAGVSLLALVVVAFSAPVPRAQSFTSGSDGSDGALLGATNCGTIVFDPLDVARWGKVLDADADGVYNFTTITINSGCTIKLQGDRVAKPVYWLATGNIVINSGGTLDLNGAGGSGSSDVNLRRTWALSGSGGFAGGVQSFGSVVANGEGPGGGIVTSSCQSQASPCGGPGTFTGNRYLIPLIGGSGGAGSSNCGGGGGGGAVLLASSTSIVNNGTISAIGGNGCSGAGGGSGGAIHLVAPSLSGGGLESVNGGASGGQASGGPGWIRLEGFVITGLTGFNPSTAVVTRGTPVNPTAFRPVGSIRVSAVDGIPVALTPTGSLTLPDVSISKLTPVSIEIEAHGIPPGTIVTLQIFSQTPTDLNTVNVTTTAPLVGTLQSSNATFQFTFPYGFSRGFVRATWTPQ